jgi:hypothetical protein
MVDSGGTLKFVQRDTASVVTLTDDDLAFAPEGSQTAPPYTSKRWQGIDLPKNVRVRYFSETTAHNISTQETPYYQNEKGQDVQVEFPFTFTEDYAKEISERMLIDAYVERLNFAFTTSYNFVYLEPGDVVTLPDPAGLVRITQVTETEDGLLQFAAVQVTPFTFSGDSSAPPQTFEDTIPVVGYSSAFVVELPTLEATDAAEVSRLTLGVHGYGLAGWPGANVYLSTDGETTYNQIATTVDECTWGRVETATPTGNYYTFDDTNTIQVTLKTGTLSSKTEAQVLDGENWALIGDEIIGFKTATLIGSPDNTYQLSGLLRGRRGTEVKMTEHAADELFLLLDDSLISVPYTNATSTVTHHVKAVTVGSDISKATSVSGQPNKVSRRPWKVADLAATQAAGSPLADWEITWTGRNQFESYMADSTEVLNPPNYGGYVIQIYVVGSPEDVKRTITQQTVGYTYTQAQQIADFGSAQSSISIRVSQIDLDTGPGYPSELTT